MKKRQLGKSALEVSPFAFGGNVFGWTADTETSHKLLDAYTDAGFNFIDTADIYKFGPVPSEIVIGKWLNKSGKRDKIILATKVGMEMSPVQKGLSKKYIINEVEESLKRLQTDYIDLYQSHKDDLDTDQNETMEAFDILVKQGKVRFIGASNFSTDRLTSAVKISEDNGYARYESLQPEYNLCERENFESGLQKICIEKEIGVITYFSLASGFLTGKYRSNADLAGSNRKNGVEKYINEKGFKILDALDIVSKEYNSTPAQISLAWLMAQPGVTSAIASATSLKQLDDLIKSAEINLNDEAIKLLNDASVY